LDARDLLVENLDVVERVITFTCRRQRLDETEAEDFASTVKLKLVENDYAIVRKFQHRSSFATFLTVVVQRMLLDYRIHLWGKWHPSAEATRLGDVAVELETLLLRDGRTIDEAVTILCSRDASITRETLQQLAARLPARAPKRKMVDLDAAASIATAPADDSGADRKRTSARVSDVIRTFIDALPSDERLLLQLRFDSDMSVAQIARSMQLDQKQLYRRIEKHLRALREDLERNGIAAEEAADLISDRGVVLDFRLGNRDVRPSKTDEETITTDQEVSR
jgi:RNA polymerase sigma factor for flagellar operon FliA